MTDLALEDVIEAIQEGLVANNGSTSFADELDREAFADHLASRFLAAAARTAIEESRTPLTADAEAELRKRAIDAYFRGGKFQVLLDVSDVTDIMVNAPDVIWMQYADGRVERWPSRLFANGEDLRNEIALLARRTGTTERRFDDGRPLLVLRLRDGSRLAAIMHVSATPQVAIRRNVLADTTLSALESKGTIDRALHTLLEAMVGAEMRCLISGETGAGKTTLLRACLATLPVHARVAVIEDTRELNLADQPERAAAVLEWETREPNIEGVGEINQRDLVRHALRFNPSWLIVGECRDGPAAREMLLAMQHGHPSMSTIHHHSATSAWKKLAQYLAQGADAIGFDIAALLISDTVDFFVHLDRDNRGRRVVSEVCEVAGWNGAEVQLNQIFVPGADGRARPQMHLTDRRRRRLVSAGLDEALLMNPDGWWT